MARGFGATLGTATTDLITTALTSEATTRSWAIRANRNGAGGGGQPRLWTKGTSTASSDTLLWDDTANILTIHLYWSTQYGIWTVAEPSDAAWHHILVTYDGGSTDNNPVVYVDGTSVSVTRATAPTGTRGTNGLAHLIGNKASQANVFDGLLAEFAVWDAILTSAEAAALGAGLTPLAIRSGARKSYVPLWGAHSPEVDLHGAGATVTGALKAAHPPVRQPAPLVAQYTTNTLSLPYTAANPLWIDNDECWDVYTDDLALALAAGGDVNIVGMSSSVSITPYNPYATEEGYTRRNTRRIANIAAAAASAWPNTPPHYAGVMGNLVKPGSGLIDDTVAIGSAATTALIAAAQAASPSTPLVVVCGGCLTTVADAYITTPSIAANLIVAWIGGTLTHAGDFNGWEDGWAAVIVADRLPLVVFPVASTTRYPVVTVPDLEALPLRTMRDYMVGKGTTPAGYDYDAPPLLAVTLGRRYAVTPVEYAATGTTTIEIGGETHEVPTWALSSGGSILLVRETDALAGHTEWWRAINAAFTLVPQYIPTVAASAAWR